MQKTANDVSLINNSGDPEGSIAANPASLCFDRTNGDLYLKSTGVGNTGWVELTAAAASDITFTTNFGSATSSGGAINLLGNHGINVTGALTTLTVAINNAITLGDLSPIGTGGNAITLTTGDLELLSGNIEMPNTTALGADGVIQWGGSRFIHNYGSNNAFLGGGAGNFTLSATQLTVLGRNAAPALTSGSHNVIIGTSACELLTTGEYNTVVGVEALFKGLGAGRNTVIGYQAMALATSASQNVAIGMLSGGSYLTATSNVSVGYLAMGSTVGDSCTAVGWSALSGATAGNYNTCVGNQSLGSLATGTNNTAIGNFAGQALTTTDSSNIMVGNAGTVGDNNTTRIGTQGAGAGQQNKTFVAGIVGVTVANATPVTINSSTGQLGVGTLSSIINWVDVTGTSSAMVPATGYIGNNVALCTLTLPASCVLGDTFKVVAKGAGLTRVAQNASQTIRLGASVTTTGVGGSLTAVAVGNTLEIVCTADDEFYVLSVIGSWTVG